MPTMSECIPLSRSNECRRAGLPLFFILSGTDLPPHGPHQLWPATRDKRKLKKSPVPTQPITVKDRPTWNLHAARVETQGTRSMTRYDLSIIRLTSQNSLSSVDPFPRMIFNKEKSL